MPIDKCPGYSTYQRSQTPWAAENLRPFSSFVILIIRWGSIHFCGAFLVTN